MHHRRKPQPHRRGGILTRVPMIGLAAGFGTLLFAILTDGGRAARSAVPLLPKLDAVVALAGFGLDQVSVTGHRFTVDSDVLDALALKENRTALHFDDAAARRRIETLPWVATAELQRVWPGQLSVEITERKPAAVWANGSRLLLLDATGRQLSAADAHAAAGLPRVEGAGAPSELTILMTALARHPEISSRVEASVREGERRWTLRLRGGGEILLPADREAVALEQLAGDRNLLRLALGGQHVVDLRVEGRTVWRETRGEARPQKAASASSRVR